MPHVLANSADYSVKFGKSIDRGLEGQKAFPFIYTFINSTDDPWKPVAAGTQPSLACIGPAIGPGATVQWPVRLDPDHNYKLISIKYTVYYWDTRDLWYRWNDLDDTGQLELGNCDVDEEHNYSTKLSRFIRITLSFQGSGSRIIYGGMDPNSIVSGTGRFPLTLEVMQGYDYGYAQVRTPYLLPREGVMIFDITNTHDVKTLTVGAAIYGLKVRI